MRPFQIGDHVRLSLDSKNYKKFRHQATKTDGSPRIGVIQVAKPNATYDWLVRWEGGRGFFYDTEDLCLDYTTNEDSLHLLKQEGV